MPPEAYPGSDVVNFWRDAGRERWFAKDDAFDKQFHDRFAALHEKAAAGALQDWLKAPYSALALVLLLDQFPRNCFRGTTRVYQTDALAREAARSAIDAGFDLQIEEPMRSFMYLPFAHSENMDDQRFSLDKSKALGGIRKTRAGSSRHCRALWSLSASQRHLRTNVDGSGAAIPGSGRL